MNNVTMQAMEAKKASLELALISSENKNNILNAIADALEQNIDDILFRNSIDVEAAQNIESSSAFIDRLTLTKDRISHDYGSPCPPYGKTNWISTM